MVADGTYLRGLGAHHNMPAVPTFPYGNGALFEYFPGFHIPQQGTVPLLMVLLNLCYHAELDGQRRKAFFLGLLGKALVHIRPLVILAFCGGEQVFGRVAQQSQLLEPHLGVFLLVVRRLLEDGCDLLIALLLGSAGEKGVFVSGLALTHKCGEEVAFGLRAFQFHGEFPFLYGMASGCHFHHSRFPGFVKEYSEFLSLFSPVVFLDNSQNSAIMGIK